MESPFKRAPGGAPEPTLISPADFPALLAPRPLDSHKGTFGAVAVVGGAAGLLGAALLAARAALRFGAGRVYVAALDAHALRVDPLQPELMFHPLATLDAATTCVVGCGLGTSDAARVQLHAALARPAPLVLDADALNLIATEAALVRAVQRRHHPTVLTPHPLEAARLLGLTVAQVQADRVGQAGRLAQALRARVLLKGAGTVLAEPDGTWAINPTGSPALATAGSGDVLAGLLGALLAQGFEPAQAVRGGVWLHGAAAQAHGADLGLVASDIAPLALQQWLRLREGRH